MTIEELDRVYTIRNTVHSYHRLGLTDLARSRQWRDDLLAYDIMEIVDRMDTTGYLISARGMHALLDAITSLEEELEQVQIDALFAGREHLDNWEQGDALARKAKQSLKIARKTVRKSTDGNK